MMKLIQEFKHFIDQLFNSELPDRSQITLEQTKIMCNMWASWKGNPRLFKNQSEFTFAVNRDLGLNKSKTTIIRHIKANLNEIIR
jgi:hypothetical protein